MLRKKANDSGFQYFEDRSSDPGVVKFNSISGTLNLDHRRTKVGVSFCR